MANFKLHKVRGRIEKERRVVVHTYDEDMAYTIFFFPAFLQRIDANFA